MRPRLEGAGTPAAFARAAAELLRVNEDLHTFVEVAGVRVATGRRAVAPNVDWGSVKRAVPGLAECRGGACGRFEDGIGYVAIPGWGGEGEEAVAGLLEAIGGMADAPGMIVDVRGNSGGNELLARRIAACFVQRPTVYSKNLIRDPGAEGGWAGPYDRIVEPAAEGARFGGRVAVLMGPACMSTCESFLLMMREPGKRELFGERSWGSSGNPRPHEVGEGVTVYLASWKDLTPEGEEIEGNGIVPDHGVPWRAGESDPVLEAALEWLRGPGESAR